MQVQAFGLSDVGKVREHNEDYLVIDPSIGLHIVCDGMGGHAAGDVASATAARTIQRCLLEQQKHLLAERITQAATETLHYGEESVSVAFEEVSAQDWNDIVYQPDIAGRWDQVYKKPGYGPLAGK